MRTGTAHFLSMQDAVKYYRQYGTDAETVRDKCQRGEIHIGPPDVPDERLSIDEDGRYHIED